jgi:cob(I)alamin adenosyltransferase
VVSPPSLPQEEVKALQDEREKLAQALTRAQGDNNHTGPTDPAVVAAMRARERELERKILELKKKEASGKLLISFGG